MADIDTQAFGFKGGGGGGGGGSVTSVGLSMPSEFNVSGSPVTSSGTLTATKANQAANQVYGSPDGASGQPSFRSLVMDDLPENSKLCTFQLNGNRNGGLGARQLLLLSTSSSDDAFYYGSFNPATFIVSQVNAATIAILDIGARFTGKVFYEVGMVLASTINRNSVVKPILGVTDLQNGSTSRTYTGVFGGGVNAASTTNESITYFSGTLSYTPSGSGDQIIFGLSETSNLTLTNGHIYVFANLKFVMQ